MIGSIIKQLFAKSPEEETPFQQGFRLARTACTGQPVQEVIRLLAAHACTDAEHWKSLDKEEKDVAGFNLGYLQGLWESLPGIVQEVLRCPQVVLTAKGEADWDLRSRSSWVSLSSLSRSNLEGMGLHFHT